MLALILLSLLSLPVAQTRSDADVVLSGRPVAKTESAADTARHTAIPEAEQEKLKVTIVRKAGRFYWASRDNRELERRVAGAFHVFVDRVDGGYIRVFDRSTLPESMRPDGPRFEYVEHVPLFRGAVTYWGAAETFLED